MPMLQEYAQNVPTEEFISIQDDKENSYDHQWVSKNRIIIQWNYLAGLDIQSLCSVYFPKIIHK